MLRDRQNQIPRPVLHRTYLPLSSLDVLHGDALGVHFINFYVLSASYGARVGRSCELALCRWVILVVSFDKEREFVGLGALNAPHRYTIAGYAKISPKNRMSATARLSLGGKAARVIDIRVDL